MKVVNDVSGLIGNTPMVRLNCGLVNQRATILAKVESMNPGGSIKDRICLSMIEMAEQSGQLKAGDTIVEPTAGNTGVGLSIVALAKGYRITLCMPENVSQEKYSLLSAYGAEIILTSVDSGMAGAIWEAEELVSRKPSHFMPNQFDNPANPLAHQQTTGQEILQTLRRSGYQQLDYLVTGVGTGGTLTGVGRALKSHFPDVKIVAVEPSVSPVLSGGEPAPTRIDGIGAGMVPKVLDLGLIDKIATVSDEDAYQAMRYIAEEEGYLVGISSGANLHAALKLAHDVGPGKTIVTFFCDTGERYLSLGQYFNGNDES